jgi:phosphoribosyl-AMP cyclohydrolase
MSVMDAHTLQAVIDRLRWDASGLIPAIVQDSETLHVLTLAYVSRESLAHMNTLGETVFWSRSRQALWHKGETSGHTQTVRELRVDCDGDALLILVQPHGPACHTGAPSCFFRTMEQYAHDVHPTA